jgi:hypothetical protein
MSRSFVFVAAMLCALSIAGPARSQDEPVPEVSSRVYDIRDLLMQRSPRTASTLVPPTRIGEPQPVVFAPEPSTNPSEAKPQTPGDKIVDLFLGSVDPDTWRDNGGSIGSIALFEGQLIVVQTEKNHAEIERMLKEFRATSSKMVTLRAHWISLDASELKAVAKPLEEDPALFAVDLAAVEKLETGKQGFTHFRGQVTCFNTQSVVMTSGDARTVVWGQQSNTGGGNNAVAYDPQSSVVQAGMHLEVTPVLTPDATTVMLDVQSVVSDWAKKDEIRSAQPTTHPSGFQPPEVDRVRMNVQQLRTSVAMPIGKPIIVGGMTFAPWSTTQDRQLYLVIEASSSSPAKRQARAREARETIAAKSDAKQ